MQLDKRDTNRSFFQIPIDEFDGSEKVSGMTINLSEGGLSYYHPISEQSQKGKILILSFKVPHTPKRLYMPVGVIHEITLEDCVIIGVAFRQLSEDVKVTIQELIEEYALFPKREVSHLRKMSLEHHMQIFPN